MRLRCALVFFLVAFMQAGAQDIRITPFALLQMPEQEAVTSLAFLAGGKTLVSGDNDGNIGCWDVEKKILLSSIRLDDPAVFLASAGGDRSYVVVDAGGRVMINDILKGTPETSFRCKGKPLRVALDAGKQFLAVASSDERVEIFDVKAMLPAGTIDARGKLDDILFLGFDRLGQQLVAIRKDGGVVSWNPATLRLARELSLAGGELHGSTTVVHAAATNRAANVFAAGLEEIAIPKGGVLGGQELMRNYIVVAYDWNSGVELKRVKTNWAVELMALGPGNDHLSVTNDENNNISLIDLRKGEMSSSVALETEAAVLVVSDDDSWLAAGSKGGTISVFQMKFKEDANVKLAAIPSLSGRIRSRSGKEPALKQGVPVKLAILGFEAKGVGEEVADICVSSMMNALANIDYVTLVERKQIERIVGEQRLQVSGLTEEEGVEVGKLSKADIVVLGSVGKLGSSLVMSARLISVTTGKVLKGREVICEECRDQDIYDAINLLTSTVAQ